MASYKFHATDVDITIKSQKKSRQNKAETSIILICWMPFLQQLPDSLRTLYIIDVLLAVMGYVHYRTYGARVHHDVYTPRRPVVFVY